MKCPIRIGHPLIDAQHDELFHCIRQLEQLGGKIDQQARIVEILKQLHVMVRHHFEAEETVMAKLPLPLPILAVHHEAHRQILAELEACILSPSDLDLQQVCVQAGAWIDQHLVEFDAPLANLIESKPVI